MFPLPNKFVHDMLALDGENARDWLNRLPDILAACEQHWHITIGPPFELSFNYVAPATRFDGTPLVLKACLPSGEFTRQAEALRLFDGHGMVQLLEYDEVEEVMLLERLLPGTLLSTLNDDQKATSIAASVMRQMRRTAPLDHLFPTVRDWGKGFARLREYFAGSCGPFPPALLTEAETLFAELAASMAENILLHGDLHHENILAATRHPWLAIDPKGLVGEPAYETGALLRNQLSRVFDAPHPTRVMARRIHQLADELNLDGERIRGWGLAQAVLSTWWNVEDFGSMREYGRATLACAELLSTISI